MATPTLRKALRVGVDMDGVLYDFVGALRLWVHTTTGRPLTDLGPATTWNFYADNWGLTLGEFLATCHAATDSGWLFHHGAPMPGTVAGIAALRSAGHEVHLVTDRASLGSPGVAEAATLSWIEAAGIVADSVTLTADKTSVPTDVFIEDRPEYFQALRETGVDAYLRSHPYNAHVPCPPTRRVRDFDQFVDRVLTGS